VTTPLPADRPGPEDLAAPPADPSPAAPHERDDTGTAGRDGPDVHGPHSCAGHPGHTHGGHAHGGRHHHAPTSWDRVLIFGMGLNLAFVLVEAGAGVATGSLALLSDAGHNLSDVLGLALALAGLLLTRVAPTRRRTYGWRSASIFAAVANGLLLLVALGVIVWEAVHRLAEPSATPGLPLIVVAGVGVAVNTATALLFVRGRRADVNLRGAFLHMVADAAVSGGVIVAGLGILATGWTWIDPVTSLIVVAVILVGTWGLLRESLDLALQAVPAGIDPEAVTGALLALDGVARVHDLHIWAMSTTETALTAHLVRPTPTADEDAFLGRARAVLAERFAIAHVTLQVERDPDVACPGEGCGPGSAETPPGPA